jgi:Calx-beta domain-containing protein
MVLKLIVALGLLLALPAPSMAEITLTGPASVPESAGVATYTVTCGLTDVFTGAFSVDPGPAPAAAAGDDYTEPSVLELPFTCVLLMPSEHTLQVPIVNDTSDEANENFTVTANTVPTQSIATTIVDDDPVASITPIVFVTEGDSGTQMANTVVTLASAAVQTTTIAFETAGLTATPGSDYTETSGNVVFQPGDLTKTISVPIVGDTAAESPEAFYVNLLSTDNGSLNPTKKQTAIGIFDPDTTPFPTVSLPKAVSVEEGDRGVGNILFDVKLSTAATQRTVVGWKTLGWTATKSDYDSANGKVVFKAGQRSKTISVDVKGDRRNEPDEAFAVELRNPVAATLGANKASFGIIEDDDGPKMRIGKPRVRGERLAVKVGCPGSADECKGKLVARSGALKLGRKRFNLDGGEAKRLKLKLSDAAQEALSEERGRAKLKATARDASGDRRVTTRRVRV